MAQGILPDRDIRRLIAEGAITLAEPAAENQVQPASLDLRLGQEGDARASELPPRPRLLRRKEAGAAGAARIRPGARRGAGDGLRLHRAAVGEPRPSLRHRGERQPEKLHRAARRLHPRHHRRGARLRPDAGRLLRPALSGGQPAHLPDPGEDRLAAVADPLPPRQRRARRRGAERAAQARNPRHRRSALHQRAGAVDRSRRRRERPRRLPRQALHRRHRRRPRRRL